MRPEAARERDLHRYYKPWKDAQNNLVHVRPDDRGEAWALTSEGYKPRASGDKTLTAFAQLAALRLDVRRAMVSLIDSSQQYILAEATRTLSLVSDQRFKPGDEVWLGNTILRRNDAVCHHTFGHKYTADEDGRHTYTTEALIVPDMRLDDRFKDKPYVTQEPGVTFYAGVPIKTRSGHRIGVYAVSDEKPRPQGLNLDELIFMEDVAAAVMEHLELAKDRDARMNGEKMVRGLADFIDGSGGDEAEASGAANGALPVTANATEDQPSLPRVSAVMKKQSENAQRILEDIEESLSASPVEENMNGEAQPGCKSTKSAKSRKIRDDPSRILTRAAKIIRQSTDADGVVFFNTSSRIFQGLGRRIVPGDHSDLSGLNSNSGSERSSEFMLHPQLRNRRSDSTDSGEDLRALSAEDKTRRALCEVIGLSVSRHEQYGGLQAEDFAFPEDNMEKYIKAFPYGKFFSFTDTGSGISSGDEQSSEEKPQDNGTTQDGKTPARTEGPARNKKERFVPTDLLKVLPGIRSLIFLPLWDFMEGRYLAGGFIWTSTAGRLMSPENELPYLKAFGNSIMSEISRVKATKSDLAKTTFIASISHELRSPLHGILGSVEFLHETAASAYQAGLFSSIETCGKTLLDTIDHVLDFAKINKLRKPYATRKLKRSHPKSGYKNEQVGSIVGLTAEFDLAALVEEVVDAVAAGHVFRRSHHVNTLDQDPGGAASTNPPSMNGLLPETRSELEPIIILDMQPRQNWFVRTQPGALRRIVMNLLGNALKYTEAGFVYVSLDTEAATDHHIKARLRFIDSGRGMSLEFQRTRLFSPFSQEDPFATGTGLGLSIVKQIVIDALGGKITIQSTQNVGTEVEVELTLHTVDKPSAKPSFDLPMDATEDSRIAVVNPSVLATEVGATLRDADLKGLRLLKNSLRDSCEGWFGMHVVDPAEGAAAAGQDPGQADSHKTLTPSFTLFPLAPTSEEALIRYYQRQDRAGTGADDSPPAIVMCSNTGQASEFRATVAARLLDKGIHTIPVTQPLGPRKLAGIIEKYNEARARRRQRIVLGRKESDPESIRRARGRLWEAREEGRAEGIAEERERSQRSSLSSPDDASPESTTNPGKRPSLSALVNVDAAADRDRDASAGQSSMTLQVVQQHSAGLRSMSAPPPGPGSMQAASPPPTIPEPVAAGGGTRPHVLLVDDNEINLSLLVMFIKKQNLAYATADNGLVALETYKAAAAAAWSRCSPVPFPFVSNKKIISSSPQEGNNASPPSEGSPGAARLHNMPPPFTHVLMDLSMPVMDGLTSTRKIRAFESENRIHPACTIIALTGLASAEAQNDAIDAGINEFLVKPVKFGELRGLLKETGGGQRTLAP